MGTMITSFSKLGVTLLDSLPELTKSTTKISKKIVLSGEQSATVKKLIPNAVEPYADVGYVVRDKYSIIHFRLRDGKKVLNQGVFSTTADGNVVKYKMRLGENSSNLSTEGFYDKSSRFDPQHWKFSGERDGNLFHTVARSNGKFANYTTVNKDYLSEFYQNLKALGANYTGLIKNGIKQLS